MLIYWVIHLVNIVKRPIIINNFTFVIYMITVYFIDLFLIENVVCIHNEVTGHNWLDSVT
jgi:hypothetical protein